MRSAPMMLTAGNALLGVFAMFLILHGRYEAVIYVILLGAILDGMDGWAARKMGVASPIGASADMISDMVSFGIVPALLVARVGGEPWGVAMGVLYLTAIAYRLLRFRLGPSIERGFVGMPSPATALATISLAIIASRQPGWHLLAAGAGLAFSILATSRIPFPKFGNPALRLMPKPIWIVIYVAHFIVFIFRPSEAVLSLMMFYLLLGPGLLHRYRLKQDAVSGAGVS